MNTYGKKSLESLKSADSRWFKIMNTVITIIDNSILYGHRTPETQFELYKKGREQLPSGEWVVKNEREVVTYKDGTKKLSTHNSYPSKAIDAVKYPIDWEDREGAILFAGIVLGVAKAYGHEVRWGGDWDRDTDMTDQAFMDLYHFELVN